MKKPMVGTKQVTTQGSRKGYSAQIESTLKIDPYLSTGSDRSPPVAVRVSVQVCCVLCQCLLKRERVLMQARAIRREQERATQNKREQERT